MNPSTIIYDSFDFVDNGLTITNIGHLAISPRQNQLEKLANRNGAVLVQSQLAEKTISINGYYIGETKVDAEQMYDVLAAVMNRQKRPLLIPHAGDSRRYIATPTSVIIQQPDGLNRLTFDFEFVVPDGYAEDEAVTTLFNRVITTPTSTIPFNVKGSVEARPIITLNYSSVSSGTNKNVSIRNSKDFVGILITRDWVSGDEVIIDSANFQIWINGVLTAPNGKLPVWQPGSGSLYYTDNFTSRGVSVVGTYNIGNL